MRIFYIDEHSNKTKVKTVVQVDFYNGYIVVTNWDFEKEKINIEDVIKIVDNADFIKQT